MAVGDLYKAVVYSSYLSADVQNRYFYRQTAGPSTGAGGLNAAMVQDLIPIIAAIQSDIVTYDRIEIINLNNTADFGVFGGVSTIVGGVSGSPMPSFAAWKCRLNRTNRSIRNGSKSFVGVVEEWTSGNNVSSTFEATVEAACLRPGLPITNANGDIYSPEIVRLLPGDVVALSVPVSGSQFVRLTTQNTRKV